APTRTQCARALTRAATPCSTTWRPSMNPPSPTPEAALPSVNALAQPLVQRLLERAELLQLTVQHDASGVLVVDAGIAARGSVAAGRAVAGPVLRGRGRGALR